MKDWNLRWNDSYAIGVERIDHQHQYFINMFNIIRDKIETGHGSEVLRHAIQEMYYYVFFHFYSEENLMRESGYRGLSDQQIAHKGFLNEFTRRIKAWDGDPASLQSLLEYLFRWFINHIADDDVAIGHHLQR